MHHPITIRVDTPTRRAPSRALHIRTGATSLGRDVRHRACRAALPVLHFSGPLGHHPRLKEAL